MSDTTTAATASSKGPDYVSLGIALIALATTALAFAATRMWPWLFVGLSVLLIVKAAIAARAGRPDVGQIEERVRKLMHVRRRGW